MKLLCSEEAEVFRNLREWDKVYEASSLKHHTRNYCHNLQMKTELLCLLVFIEGSDGI